MALLPHPPQLPGAPSDKLQHIVAFATVAGLGSIAYRKMGLMRLLASLSAFGAIIEVLQRIPALHRDGDPLDWAADTIAAAMVLTAVWWRRRAQESSGD